VFEAVDSSGTVSGRSPAQVNVPAASFDPIWTALQGAGSNLSRYPWDCVVSFVFRNAPPDRPRKEVRILEIGCGGGPNVWFAAREGFTVAGIDASEPAIEHARARLAADGLEADLRVGDFTELPFEDASFDLVIDHCAITCTGRTAGAEAVAEVRRVLVDGGRFLFIPYGDRHSSARSGVPGPDGVTLGIGWGSLVGVGQICFYTRSEVERVFAEGWTLESVELVDLTGPQGGVHEEWHAIARKEPSR
jgi:SAM-dependent methyltransferase